MGRASYAVVSVLLAVLVASAAMPASAHINLLQNPGFETGEEDPWEIVGGGLTHTSHTGDYAAYVELIGGGEGWVWQGIDPQCAEYLEFWYHGGYDVPGDWEYGVYYSDGTEYWEDLSYMYDWASVHEDLDTTKLVEAVEVWITTTTGYVFFGVDDFDLEACAAPPPVGGEVMTPTPIPSPVMLIAVMAAASAVALGYRFTRR